jgi:hypothetical protein
MQVTISSCNYINTSAGGNVKTTISNTQTYTSIQCNHREKQDQIIQMKICKLELQDSKQEIIRPPPTQPPAHRHNFRGFAKHLSTISHYSNILWNPPFPSFLFLYFYTFLSLKSLTISNEFY